MNKKILIGSIIAVTVLILPSSIVIGVDDINTNNNVIENNLELEYKSFFVLDLLIGKISNLTLGGGWTPCYFFHIEKCLIFSTFIPFFRIRHNRDAIMVRPRFVGFINDYFIFGFTDTLNLIPN